MRLILVVYVIAFLVDKYSYIMAGPANVPTKNESSSIIDLNECKQTVDSDSWIPDMCVNVTRSAVNGDGPDAIILWNNSNSSDPFIVVLRVYNNLRTLQTLKCFPDELISTNSIVTSGISSSVLKFSLFKTKSITNPLIEPIEVAIPIAAVDQCIEISGTYLTAKKRNVPCAEPHGIIPSESHKNVPKMPLFVYKRMSSKTLPDALRS